MFHRPISRNTIYWIWWLLIFFRIIDSKDIILELVFLTTLLQGFISDSINARPLQWSCNFLTLLTLWENISFQFIFFGVVYKGLKLVLVRVYECTYKRYMFKFRNKHIIYNIIVITPINGSNQAQTRNIEGEGTLLEVTTLIFVC